MVKVIAFGAKSSVVQRHPPCLWKARRDKWCFLNGCPRELIQRREPSSDQSGRWEKSQRPLADPENEGALACREETGGPLVWGWERLLQTTSSKNFLGPVDFAGSTEAKLARCGEYPVRWKHCWQSTQSVVHILSWKHQHSIRKDMAVGGQGAFFDGVSLNLPGNKALLGNCWPNTKGLVSSRDEDTTMHFFLRVPNLEVDLLDSWSVFTRDNPSNTYNLCMDFLLYSKHLYLFVGLKPHLPLSPVRRPCCANWQCTVPDR